MFKEHIFPNKLKLVANRLENSFSANIGVFIKSGTQNELNENYGCAHFLEHMLFKGTKKRTALEIAETIDSIGGIINAYTTHEFTSFYTKTLKEDAGLALDVLYDMLFNSSFLPIEIEKEKKVIIEEIHMYEDEPNSFVLEEFSKNLFKGSPFGLSILGDKKLIKKIDRQIILDYHKAHYRPENMVIVVTGDFDDSLIGDIGMTFGDIFCNDEEQVCLDYRNKSLEFDIKIIERNNVKQIYFAAGYPGLGKTNPDYYKLELFNNIIGASTSSYLFQQLREKLSLCYDIGSFISAFKDTGEFVINGGSNVESFPLALHELYDILDAITRNGVKSQEFERARKQIKSQMAMSFENPQDIMFKIAADLIYFDKYLDIEYIIKKIDLIDYEEFNDFVKSYLSTNKLSVCLLGPKGTKSYAKIWEGLISDEKIENQNHVTTI